MRWQWFGLCACMFVAGVIVVADPRLRYMGAGILFGYAVTIFSWLLFSQPSTLP